MREKGDKQKETKKRETEKDAQRTEMQRDTETGKETEKWGRGWEGKRQRDTQRKEKKGKLIHRDREWHQGDRKSTIQRMTERQSRERDRQTEE